MSDVKWIKIATNIFDDEKIKLIEVLPEADGMIVIWFKLLCLAGKQNNNGIFMMNDKLAYTDEMLSTIFRKPLPLVRLALGTFEQYGMIEIVDNVITLPNWDKHQNVEGLEKIREQTRKRVANHRQNQKQLVAQTESNATCNVTVTQCNAIEIDKEIELEEKKKNIKEKKPYGEFNNVLLYDEELTKLQNKFNDYKERIENLSQYLASTGKKYKSHYATILSWARKDNKTTTSSTSKKPDWLIKYEEEFESTVECL